MNRRDALRFLGVAPVVAPIAATSAVNPAPIGHAVAPLHLKIDWQEISESMGDIVRQEAQGLRRRLDLFSNWQGDTSVAAQVDADFLIIEGADA